MLAGFIVFTILMVICWVASKVIPTDPEKYDRTTDAEIAFAATKWIWRLGALFLVLAILMAGLDSIRIIEAGEGGVITRLGAVTERKVEPGPVFKVPFIESIHRYDTKVQKIDFENLEAASTELQSINVTGTLNYRLNPNAIPWLYQNVGSQSDLETKFLIKSLTDSLKTEMPDWPIETVLANRGPIANEVVLELISDSATFTDDNGDPVIFFTASEDGIAETTCEDEEVVVEERSVDEEGRPVVELVTTTVEICGPEGEVLHLINIGFSASFDGAIEARQAELVKIAIARNVLEQRRIEAQQEIAIAEGTAKANTILAESLETRGNFILQFKAIEELAAGNVKLIILPEDNGLIPILGQDLLGGTAPPTP